MRRVIIAGGPLYNYAAIFNLLCSTDDIVCADSGARHAHMLGVVPNTVIGDMDSIDDKTLGWLREHRVRQITYPIKKDQSDTEICLLHEPIPTTTLLIASLGGRPDHTLSTLLLMGKFSRDHHKISLFDGQTWVVADAGPSTVRIDFKSLQIAHPERLYVSIFPVFSAVGPVTTKNLLYPLDSQVILPGDTLCLSNRVVQGAEYMSVTTDKGVVLMMLTPQEASDI